MSGSIFFRRRRILRRLVCLAVMAGLLICPSPWVTLKPILDPVSVLASTIDSAAGSVASTVGSAVRELRSAPFVLIPSGPIVIPVPMLPVWPFSIGSLPQVRMVDRIARVSTIKVSPHRMVAYVGETVTFVAMGTDLSGGLVHGAKFSWESSDTNKLTIDEAGRARLLRPGMVIVTARAGLAAKTAPVLIRPNHRPVQTDAEWRADQDSFVSSTGNQTGVEGVLASLAEKLAPTAHAQAGSSGDYPIAAQQVGTPMFAQLEETRIGPVIPKLNFELPIPLVNLGGRGMATSLMAYYNSNVWGAYFDPITNATVYVFDPIQGWPSPGLLARLWPNRILQRLHRWESRFVAQLHAHRSKRHSARAGIGTIDRQ